MIEKLLIFQSLERIIGPNWICCKDLNIAGWDSNTDGERNDRQRKPVPRIPDVLRSKEKAAVQEHLQDAPLVHDLGLGPGVHPPPRPPSITLR